jgi:uncharacterized protein YbjT (DUF2867 family)
MKVAIATPTGHVGSKLASHLLGKGAELTLLCRDPKEVQALTAKGAKAETGDLRDGEYLIHATKNTDALFWLSPPDFGAPDIFAFQTALARNAAGAIRKNSIKHVVNLSSIGAQLQSGTGPVAGLHRVENILNETGASVTHLRPGYFMENFLFSLDTIKSMGSIFLPVRGSCRLPMLATQDIARVAADCFTDTSWTGTRVRGIHGPKDMTFDEAAGTLSEVLGRPVRHVTVTVEQTRDAFLGMGASPDTAAKYAEMYKAMDDGTFKIAEPRSPETSTPTTFADFTREVVKPLVP